MRERGQASLETVAVTALVTALISAAGALAAFAPLGDAVARQLQRGLCVVRAGDCERDRLPCATGSVEQGSHDSVRIAFVRLDSRRAVLVEDLSDGTVRLSVMGGGAIGLEAALGATVDLDFGKVAFGIGGELRAAALAATRSGASFTMPSAQAADRLRRWIADPKQLVLDPPLELLDPRRARDELPVAESVYGEAGFVAKLGATGVVDPVVQGDVTLDSDDALGVRRDVRTGHRTIYFRREAGFDAALGVGPEGMRRIGGLGRRETTIYGLELDRDGRPVDFSVSTVEPLVDRAQLPDELREHGAALVVGTGSRVLATERHLDVTQAENLEAVRGFMRYVGVKRLALGIAAPVVERLAGRMDAAATYSARSYAVRSDDRKLGASVALGAELGAESSAYTTTSRLLAALDRGPSGTWATGSFCRPS